ncbi:unnamed protein product [Rotaria sordida]|uniref:Uncharacterized protein n=1 Tax=Rotaria sordida TaxID=392033 RepID=A0A814HI35_9BILA|nr:unnamed protein product [Rotaria sordida]CAF3986241.1 unnamed protein product [Rotaria sordida]
MFHTKISSSSSKSTFEFDTSSIQTNDSEEKFHSPKSIICLNDKNFNRNANDIYEDLNKDHPFLYRSIRSSTDITTNNLYSSINENNPCRENEPIRIESALITSDDYVHRLNHTIIRESQPIIDINMNRTIDRFKRNGAGDENLSSHINNKQIQTSSMRDNNHYLILEQVPIHNRRTIQFSSKQLILISSSVFVFAVLLCLTMIFFIF